MRAFTLSEAVELCRRRRAACDNDDGESRERKQDGQDRSFAMMFETRQQERRWQTQ